jgi:hypothetical protein
VPLAPKKDEVGLPCLGKLAFQVLCCLRPGEAHLLAGCLEKAHSLATRALALFCEHQQHSSQAYALHLLGEIAVQSESREVEAAEAHYRQALALAEELGMGPLLAPLPPGSRHALCHNRPAGAGPHRALESS